LASLSGTGLRLVSSDSAEKSTPQGQASEGHLWLNAIIGLRFFWRGHLGPVGRGAGGGSPPPPRPKRNASTLHGGVQ
jgi:hypothetical protein